MPDAPLRRSTSFPADDPSATAENAYYADLAALLDPSCYELVVSTGSAVTRTVDDGETWYLVGGWQLNMGGGSTNSFFHRKPDCLQQAIPLKAGTVIATQAVNGAHMYLCKPADAWEGDDRYDSSRDLFYERMRRLQAELAHFQVGASNSGNGTNVDTAFPTDFTNGLVVHVSSNDVAWSGLLNAAETLALNLDNEISDSAPIRFAERTLCPFVRTTFPKHRSRGVNLASGVAVARYVKLPADW